MASASRAVMTLFLPKMINGNLGRTDLSLSASWAIWCHVWVVCWQSLTLSSTSVRWERHGLLLSGDPHCRVCSCVESLLLSFSFHFPPCWPQVVSKLFVCVFVYRYNPPTETDWSTKTLCLLYLEDIKVSLLTALNYVFIFFGVEAKRIRLKSLYTP